MEGPFWALCDNWKIFTSHYFVCAEDDDAISVEADCPESKKLSRWTHASTESVASEWKLSTTTLVTGEFAPTGMPDITWLQQGTIPSVQLASTSPLAKDWAVAGSKNRVKSRCQMDNLAL